MSYPSEGYPSNDMNGLGLEQYDMSAPSIVFQTADILAQRKTVFISKLL